MNTIRTIYHGTEPAFPPTDQHPDARRFYVTAGVITEAAQETPHEQDRMAILQGRIKETSKALEAAVNAINDDKEQIMLAATELEAATMALSVAEATADDAAIGLAAQNAEITMKKWAGRSPEIQPALLADQTAALSAYAAAFAKDMPEDQRAFLRRITDPAARAIYIGADRKERAQVMAAAAPLDYVVDALEPPTMEAIEAIINPPAPPSEAMRAVELIRGDPAALAELKGMLANGQP